MLELDKAKHILEIACGTCRLLPLAINLRSQEATYLATDLTQAMVDLSHKRINEYILKAGVEIPLEDWLKKRNITIKQANG